MLHLLARLALICVLLSLGPAARAFDCPQHFLETKPPAVADQPAGTVELCNDAFATLWSPVTRDPVYSAEHLTVAGLTKADALPRKDFFHPDPRLMRLGPGVPALLSDYRGSGFDRGHLAPNHDMPDKPSQAESFALSNMIPQNPANNHGPWAQIEEAVRTLVVSVFQGEGYVVTGPTWWCGVGPVGCASGKGTGPRTLNSRVAIPDRIWKALYVPGDSFGNQPVVGAWIVDNTAKPNTRFVSIAALTAEIGIDPFPGLPTDLRDKALLPPGAAKRTGVAGGM